MDEEFKFSPLRVDPNCNCDVQTADGIYGIGSTHPSVLSGGETLPGTARAYATLFAAAPDMFHALRGLLDNLSEGDFISEDRIDAARSAIAKALGR